MTPRSRFDLVDAALFGLGVLGLVLFLYLLPSQHPDSAATYALGREVAVERAEAFLSQQGYDTADLVPNARLRRATRLLDSLQAALPRPDVIQMLQAGGGEALPAYYWEVQWRRARDQTPYTPGGGGPPRLVFDVDLTQAGAVWQFSNTQSVVPRAGVDRNVLRAIVDSEAAPAPDGSMGEMLMAPADSALASLLRFNLPSEPVLAENLPPMQADRERLYAAAETGRPQELSATMAAAIAREHLNATSLAGQPFSLHSVEALPERGQSAARVRFETDPPSPGPDPLHGQRLSTTVDVTAAGALLGLDVITNEEVSVNEADRAEVNDNVSFSFESGETIRDVVKGICYVLLGLLLLVVMVRQLSSRSLDSRAALKDAMLTGVMVAAWIGLTSPGWLGDAPMTPWVFLLFGMLFNGTGFGLLVFIASSASDALARSAWPQQIETLSLARQGAFVNQPVGRTLVRGVAVAGVLLGVYVLLLTAMPSGALAFETGLLNAEATYSVFGASAVGSLWYGLLLTLAVYVGLGSMLRRWRTGAGAIGLALAIGLIGFGVLDLPAGTPWAMWGIPLVLGAVLAWVYIRYDALTVLVAIFVTSVLWDTAEGWLVTASPAFGDAVLGFGLAAGLVAFGLVGVQSKRTGEMLPRYVPDYVIEQRERGRLTRELEIAREVQRSFLPAQMPCIPGLDIAARCIAAEEVGGDYYDVIPLDSHRLALVIGDVSGKGIQAAFFMTLAKGFLQTLARETDSPAEVLRRANRLFVANATPGTFISLIYGIFDLETETFTFARAGHNPVILKRSPNQTADFIQPPGLAIGLTAQHVFDDVIREQTIPLRRGDTLVLYTDGFSESMNVAKTLYTDERLADTVAATSGDTSAEDLLQAMVSDVLSHAGTAPQHDDMTMVVVRVGTDDARPLPDDTSLSAATTSL